MGLLNGLLRVRVSITCLLIHVEFLMAFSEHCIVM